MTSEFLIPVHDLDAAGRAMCLPIRVSWMRGAFEETDVGPADAEGRLDLRISRSGTDVIVRGALEAVVVVACSRCLEPARIAVQEEISALAVHGTQEDRPTAAVRERDRDGDLREQVGSDLIRYDGDTLVLDDVVRDVLLLGIPMLPLCSESCPGIRPELSQATVETNGVDPRLQPLLNLRKSST
ncbi:MAG: DUF177 domain-containing protein [Polyangiaceae bacterium]|jgi:uncharacterized protein